MTKNKLERSLGFALLLGLGALLLSACSSAQTTALPTVELQDNTSAMNQTTPAAGAGGSYATASGVLVSDHQSELAFLTSGSVKQVNVSVGQTVKKGDLLAEMDNTILKIQLDQANEVLAGLTSPSAISTAQKAVADDQANYNTALGTLLWWRNLQKNSQDLLKKANADMVVALDDLKDARDNYNKYYENEPTDKNKAMAYQRMYDAQQKVDDIQKRIDLYSNTDPSQLSQYQANVDVAKSKLADDMALVDALTGAAQTDNSSCTGCTQLVQARLAVQLAQANLRNTQLISPIDGNVSEINFSVGDFVQAGQIEIVITDPQHLHVETTDLSERDVTNVKVGQSVTVAIKPTNQQVNGKVTAVSPLAQTLGGDTVYKAFIQLDGLPKGALPGMSVTVEFLAQ